MLCSLWGCPGTLDEQLFALQAGTGVFDCVDFSENLIAGRCVTACHEAGGQYPSLNLQGNDYAAALIDSPTNKSECDPTLRLINSENPVESLMFTKVTADFPCGRRMPFVGRTLDEAEADCMLEWVESVLENAGYTTDPASD